MSDLNNPNNPNNFDKYGNPLPPAARFEYEPTANTGRAPYILLGLLVLIGIVGGTMYFNGGHRTTSDVAVAPPRMSDPAPAPTAPMATPVTPAPADKQ